MKKIISSIIFIIVMVVLQITVIDSYASGSLLFNLPLLAIIYFNWLYPNLRTFVLTIAISWGISYFSILPFGAELIYFSLIALFIQYLVLNKLTSQTYGSLLIAGIVGLSVYDFTILIMIKNKNLAYVHSLQAWFFDPAYLITQFILAEAALFIIYKLTIKHGDRQISIAI